MYRRGEQKDLDQVIDGLLKRIKTLEDLSVRQSLPSSYEWSIDGSNQLIIRRKSDNTVVVIL